MMEQGDVLIRSPSRDRETISCADLQRYPVDSRDPPVEAMAWLKSDAFTYAWLPDQMINKHTMVVRVCLGPSGRRCCVSQACRVRVDVVKAGTAADYSQE